MCGTVVYAWHAPSRTAPVWFIPFLALQRNWEDIAVLSVYLKNAAGTDKELLTPLQKNNKKS